MINLAVNFGMKRFFVGVKIKSCSPLFLPNNALIEHNNVMGKEMPLYGGDDRTKAIAACRRNKGSLSGVGNATLQLLARPRGDIGWLIDDNELVLSPKVEVGQ